MQGIHSAICKHKYFAFKVALTIIVPLCMYFAYGWYSLSKQNEPKYPNALIFLSGSGGEIGINLWSAKQNTPRSLSNDKGIEVAWRYVGHGMEGDVYQFSVLLNEKIFSEGHFSFEGIRKDIFTHEKNIIYVRP